MFEHSRSFRRVLLGAALAACLLPAPAAAQRVLVTHPLLISARLTASGAHLFDVITNRFVVGDDDEIADLYRYTLALGTWTRVPRAALVSGFDPRATIEVLSMSDDGRYVAYVASRPTGQRPPDPTLQSVLSRYDVLTGTRQVIRDSAADPFEQPVMSRDGSTFAWVGANSAVLVQTVGQRPVAIGQACATSASTCPAAVLLTASGDRVLYATIAGDDATLETFERASLVRRRHDAFRFEPAARLVTTAFGSSVLATAAPPGSGRVLDVSSGRVEPVAALDAARPSLTDDGTYVLGGNGGVVDRRLGAELSLLAPRKFPGADDYVCCLTGLSADGRIGLGRNRFDQSVLLDLDGDADGMFDPWENLFGLDPADATDAAADPDADGVANADEARLRSNPFGFHRRVFAEGVSSPYFDTTFHVFEVPTRQTGPRRTEGYVVTFLGDNGVRQSSWRRRRAFGESPTIPPPASLGTSQYATVVESELPIAVERITSWGGPPAAGVHGTSGATPSTQWFFAEGATTRPFQLFYLLANIGDVDALVDIDYLLAAGRRETRRYLVPAGHRRTVWVNQEGGALGSAEVAARITSTQPIVAERSMYTTGGGGLAAGTASMGVTAPSRTWMFAEGATGSVFDAFVLLANPSAGPAQVVLTFRLPDGQAVIRTVPVPAESRVTVWVDQQDAQLADTAFTTSVVSDVPVVAERAMWWRGASSAAWIEGHTEAGATAGASRWAVAEMPESAFLLIANTASRPGQVQVTYYSENGGGAASRTYQLPADGRVTAWPTQDNPALPPARYRAVVESLPMTTEPPVPIVVERAAYGAGLTTGSVYLATPVP